jgi:hypothetical protein
MTFLTGLSRNIDTIRKYSGAKIIVQEVQSNGSDTSPASATIDLGVIKDHEINDETQKEALKDASGATIKNEFGERESVITATLWQTDKTIMNIPETVKGKYCRVSIKWTNDEEATQQWQFYGLAEVTPKINRKAPGEGIPIEISGLKMPQTVTLATTSLTSAIGTGFAMSLTGAPTLSVSANTFYEIFEQNV